jgi:hypothetical protein
MGGACVGVEDGDPAGTCKAAAAIFCVSSGVEASLAVSLIQCRWCPLLVRVSLSVPIFSLSFFPSNKQFYPDIRPMANHSIFLPSLPDMVIEGHVTFHFRRYWPPHLRVLPLLILIQSFYHTNAINHPKAFLLLHHIAGSSASLFRHDDK